MFVAKFSLLYIKLNFIVFFRMSIYCLQFVQTAAFLGQCFRFSLCALKAGVFDFVLRQMAPKSPFCSQNMAIPEKFTRSGLLDLLRRVETNCICYGASPCLFCERSEPDGGDLCQ